MADGEHERVVDVDLGVRWDPNAQKPWLIQHNSSAVLVLTPWLGESTPVLLHWTGSRIAVLGPPNDEARAGHRLWSAGLDRCLWAGEVLHSEWVASLERQNRVHPRHRPDRYDGLRHFILPLKENTFEVIARGFAVHRPESTPVAAALKLVRDHQSRPSPLEHEGPARPPRPEI